MKFRPRVIKFRDLATSRILLIDTIIPGTRLTSSEEKKF